MPYNTPLPSWTFTDAIATGGTFNSTAAEAVAQNLFGMSIPFLMDDIISNPCAPPRCPRHYLQRQEQHHYFWFNHLHLLRFGNGNWHPRPALERARPVVLAQRHVSLLHFELYFELDVEHDDEYRERWLAVERGLDAPDEPRDERWHAWQRVVFPRSVGEAAATPGRR